MNSPCNASIPDSAPRPASRRRPPEHSAPRPTEPEALAHPALHDPPRMKIRAAKKKQNKKVKAANGQAVPAAKGGIAVGAKAPDFTLPNQADEPVSLDDLLKGKRGLVIFWYPRANTPGCTKQACGFTENYDTLTKQGFEVVGMSADNPTPQANWKRKHAMPFQLLCDRDKSVMKKYGVYKGDKIKRSHVIISAKDRTFLDVQIQISPLASVDLATKFVTEYTD